MTWSLHDARGRRKYLVAAERQQFLRAALEMGGQTATFCAVLVFCGARISEVLALTAGRLDEANSAINFETLKRRKHHTRAVPVPLKLLAHLDRVHHFRDLRSKPETADRLLWDWSRTTAWRRVKDVMRRAEHPPHISKPKSLRHAFGVEAYLNNAGLTMIQKWLGHADIRTTLIYTNVIGDEERAMAQRTWAAVEKLL